MSANRSDIETREERIAAVGDLIAGYERQNLALEKAIRAPWWVRLFSNVALYVEVLAWNNERIAYWQERLDNDDLL